MNSLALYLRYLALSFRGQMQYRASFLMQTLGQFVATGIEFIALWALFARFGSLRGWTLPEVALFYAVVNIAFSIADAMSRGFDMFGYLVKQGEFDRILLRPRSTVLQLLGHEFTLKRVGRFLQAVAVLIWALSVLHVQWTVATVTLLLGAVLSAAALFLGLLILQATLAFWTVETLEMFATVTYGGVETMQYPLSIYDRWFRRFFTFVVPLAGVCYYPVLTVLGKPETAPWVGWLSPLVGFVFLAACLQVWKFGVRHYRSTGS